MAVINGYFRKIRLLTLDFSKVYIESSAAINDGRSVSVGSHHVNER